MIRPSRSDRCHKARMRYPAAARLKARTMLFPGWPSRRPDGRSHHRIVGLNLDKLRRMQSHFAHSRLVIQFGIRRCNESELVEVLEELDAVPSEALVETGSCR
jgi:hypothetical protein